MATKSSLAAESLLFYFLHDIHIFLSYKTASDDLILSCIFVIGPPVCKINLYVP